MTSTGQIADELNRLSVREQVDLARRDIAADRVEALRRTRSSLDEQDGLIFLEAMETARRAEPHA